MNPQLSPVTASLIKSQKDLAKIYNDAAVADYNIKLANAQSNLDRGFSAPLPKAPMLMIVDENAIINTEQNYLTGSAQPSFVTWIQYVPIVAAPPAPRPLVLSATVTGYPGFYEADGDGPDIKVGTVDPLGQTGHSYRKTVVSQSPFAPNGQVCLWQQIS